MNPLVIVASLYLVCSIIVFWMTTFAIREKRRFRPFLPLLLVGSALCLMAAVSFYDLLLTGWHFTFTILFFLGLLWLLIEYQLENHS